MRKALPLLLAGAIALALGAVGSVAVASGLSQSSSDAVESVKDDPAEVPAVYGTK